MGFGFIIFSSPGLLLDDSQRHAWPNLIERGLLPDTFTGTLGPQ